MKNPKVSVGANAQKTGFTKDARKEQFKHRTGIIKFGKRLVQLFPAESNFCRLWVAIKM